MFNQSVMTALETRQRLLETARRLFHEQGYHATGIATILREAEVNSGSLYHHFSGKEDLLRGVLERYLELLDPMVMDPARERAEDPIERVFALLSLYREGLEITGCSMGCPIGNLALELADDLPDIGRLIDRNFRQWTDRVRAWLEEARHRLPRDADLDGLAAFVLTVMEGAIMQARARRTLEPFDASVARLRDYFDRLLEARSRD